MEMDPESAALHRELETHAWADEFIATEGEFLYDRLLGSSREDAVQELGRLKLMEAVAREHERRWRERERETEELLRGLLG